MLAHSVQVGPIINPPWSQALSINEVYHYGALASNQESPDLVSLMVKTIL